MNLRNLTYALAVLLLSAALPALAQIIPKDAAEPVEVRKPKGEFAKKLHGALMPKGSGWKAATDRESLVQIMVPESWQIDPRPEGEAIIHVTPPASGGDPRAVLLVTFGTPRDADPLQVDEEFAASYADELTAEPELKRLDFKPTDSGFVVMRGLKFALAGGTMTSGTKPKETFRQQQLVYISEDRLVTIQFTALDSDFPTYADDVARIFASYQNLGVRKQAEVD